MDGFTRSLCTLVLAVVVGVMAAPGIATAFEYQTDLLNFGRFGYSDGSSAEFPVTGFQYDVRFNQSSTCDDPETCDGPVRDLGTFVWFTPITVNIGSDKGVTDFALHGGPARGGSGWRHEGITSWYIDWSGYEAGGPALIDPETGWTHKAHNLRPLWPKRWYRIRVSRVGCEQENGLIGYGWNMEVWHRPGTTWDYVGSAGTWCLPRSADTISAAYAFIEIIEDNPCNTDFNYADMRNFRYKDASGKWKFIDEADARYGGTADADAQCTDTNWRRVSDSPGWMRNVRDQTRGKYGGLTIPGDTGVVGAWDWWPSLSDVSRSSSYFLYVGTIEEDGVVDGCTWNKFCPNGALTRGQMAKVIVRAMGEATGTYQGYFNDVPNTHPFWPEIEAIKELGITVGCNPPANSLYCPDTKVKRAQLATFLARALDIDHLKAGKDHFTDDNGIVHENNINLLRDRGIINGCGGTGFCPWAAVKRKDMARWVVRAFNLWQGAP